MGAWGEKEGMEREREKGGGRKEEIEKKERKNEGRGCMTDRKDGDGK